MERQVPCSGICATQLFGMGDGAMKLGGDVVRLADGRDAANTKLESEIFERFKFWV